MLRRSYARRDRYQNKPVYTPNSEAGFQAWYDAYDVAPKTGSSAITTWNDRSGSATHLLSGTATAFAAGGSGPNGLAYVQSNGTTDKMQFVQSSVHIFSEWFIVAEYSAAGAAGTLCDGSAGNDGRIYRTATTTLDFTHGTTVTGSTSALTTWCIYHAFCDGVNITVNVNGSQVINGANVSAGVDNGFTLFNFGAGGDAAAARVAIVVGYSGLLSAAARTRVVNYLSLKAGLTGQS